MNHLFSLTDFMVKPFDGNSLNVQFLNRYPTIPIEYLKFLASFSLLTNLSDTTWFNSISDFNETNTESDFKWNEFERMSLESSEDFPDVKKKVIEFWNHHLPIILSVKNGYSFFAINVSEDHFGKIYFGEEPEFEEVDLVDDDFVSFMEKLTHKNLPTHYQELF